MFRPVFVRTTCSTIGGTAVVWECLGGLDPPTTAPRNKNSLGNEGTKGILYPEKFYPPTHEEWGEFDPPPQPTTQ